MASNDSKEMKGSEEKQNGRGGFLRCARLGLDELAYGFAAGGVPVVVRALCFLR